MDIQILVLPNGNLMLSADEEARAAIIPADGNYTDHPREMYDLMEPYSTNGSFTLFDAGDGNPMVGLTSAPCIAESMVSDELGQNAVHGKLWWYPSYETTSYVQKLVLEGQVVFQAA